MKTETPITLSEELWQVIDQQAGQLHQNRSMFIETAVRAFLARLEERRAIDQRDLAIMNAHADELNAEISDVLDYQIE